MPAELIERTDDEFEEYLNNSFGDVDVMGTRFGSGTILRELDPIAFNCAMSDEPEQWKCTECDSVYENEEEAEECCKEEE